MNSHYCPSCQKSKKCLSFRYNFDTTLDEHTLSCGHVLNCTYKKGIWSETLKKFGERRLKNEL